MTDRRHASPRIRLPAPNEATRLYEFDADEQFGRDRSLSVDSSLGIQEREGPRRRTSRTRARR